MNTFGIPALSLGEWESKSEPTDAVRSLVNACTDYLQALTMLCNAGIKLVKNFVDPSSVALLIQQPQRDQAQKMWTAWEEVNSTTLQSSRMFGSHTLQALQDWLKKKEVEEEEEHSDTVNSLELPKLVNACLNAVLQLQYEFSLLTCPTLAELSVSRVPSSPISSEEHNDESAYSSLPSAIKTFSSTHNPITCVSQFDAQNSPNENDEDDDDEDDNLEPSMNMMGRRSSYGGSLNTSPPPSNALGRRWSVPGGDSALEEGWTREIQRRAGSKGFRPAHECGRAILGTGRLHKRKGSLVSKEELDEVIDLLSGGPGVRLDRLSFSPSHPLNLSLPSCTLSEWSASNVPEARRGGSVNWLSSLSQNPVSVDGGLLAVAASSPSFENKDCKSGGWSAVHRLPSHLSKTSSSSHEQRLQPPPSVPSPPSTTAPSLLPANIPACTEEMGDSEGAFSIGLDLVGTNLVASVQQRHLHEEPRSSLATGTYATDTNEQEVKNKMDDSAGEHPVWLRSKHVANSINSAAFLPFALDGPNGSTIWSPSPNDYTSPNGNYPFQIRP